jgi:hypothetical protein
MADLCWAQKVPKVKCTFEYAAANSDELSMAVGDVITVLDKSDPDWWEGELKGQSLSGLVLRSRKFYG